MQKWCYDRKASENTILHTITWQNCQKTQKTLSCILWLGYFRPPRICMETAHCVTLEPQQRLLRQPASLLWLLRRSKYSAFTHLWQLCLFIQMDCVYKYICVWMLEQSLNSPAVQSAGQKVKLWNKMRSAWPFCNVNHSFRHLYHNDLYCQSPPFLNVSLHTKLESFRHFSQNCL